MRLAGRADVIALLESLPDRPLNYRPTDIDETWVRESHRHPVGHERPGPPQADDLFARAEAVVRDYAFTPPNIIRAFYNPREPLQGRNMLLEGRFLPFKFLMPVRITAVHSFSDDEHTVAGWAYETLRGHFERGRVDYTVVKDHSTGQIDFNIDTVWQLHPGAHPVIRLGWSLFGDRTRRAFYSRSGSRLRDLSKPRPPVVKVPAPSSASRGLLLLNTTDDDQPPSSRRQQHP
ncbi:DUF1990 family protein [Kribbella sp. CA-293567]|uniref:DUF1990 family protein n=1 Tax=Kribbella sp. CA-293567 TaxID=3002436 RepID=UPI0022DD5A81|nr:DUF1990 family protein [Kribbella sp. CA-293567]WBQ08689.1 DUF1990 family protein [Kribbella sp. CA-293567]